MCRKRQKLPRCPPVHHPNLHDDWIRLQKCWERLSAHHNFVDGSIVVLDCIQLSFDRATLFASVARLIRKGKDAKRKDLEAEIEEHELDIRFLEK